MALMRSTFVTRRQALGGLAALGLATPHVARAARPELKGSGQVVVFDGGGAWGKAEKEAYFTPFQQETGIEVVASPRAPAGRFRSSILAGAPAYDVSDISAGLLGTFTKEDLLMPIDYKYFDPADRDAFKPVAAGTHMVPSLFYSLVIAYDNGRFASHPPKSWADVWDLKAFPGQRTLAGGTRVGGATFEVALLADGVAPDKLYPLDWDRALRSLDRIRPGILKFWDAGAEPVQLLVDRNVALASAWNGRITDVQDKGGKVGMEWNGGVLQWDAWVVPKGAANADNAMKFLAFAARPEQQAKFAEHIAYGPTNARAYDLIKPDRAAILPTAPQVRDKQVVQDYDFWAAETRPGFTNEQRAVELWEKWVTKG